MIGTRQQQQHVTQQIVEVIRNFRKVTTRTGKPMAVFTIGTLPAKCFDVAVDTAAHWAETGKKVLITGQFSNHRGQIELVAQNISLAPPSQTSAQPRVSQGGYADILAQNQASMRESSTIVENLSGCVSDMKTMNTYSNRPMITFRIGGTPCKALGELATAIQKVEGKQIEVSARKGSFRGLTEYAITTLKTIDGTIVDLRDSFKPEPVAPSPATSSSLIDSIQQQMHEAVTLTESERKQIAEGIAEPKAGLSETDDADDIPGFEAFDPGAYGIKQESIESFRFLSAPAKPAAPTTEAGPVTEPIAAKGKPENQPGLVPELEPVSVRKPLKEVLVQYWIDIMDDTPSHYPEEKLRQLSLESGEEAEAARRILARYEAERATPEAPEPEFKRKELGG
jgi:hypothetical protein